jgi:hexosaminidase
MTRFLLIAAASIAASAAPLPLMPMPEKVVLAEGRLAIDSHFRIASAGRQDRRLEAALRRFTARVARQTGLPIAPGNGVTLRVECRESGSEYPSLGEDESYRLDISPSQAVLNARTVTGVLRGLETFAQLIAPGPDGFEVPAVHIEDRPRFPWRGLMLDAARHWMPVDAIERNLDGMAAVKLNVFHWHLSDDQGFRVESKRFPRLQQYGSDGNFYTQTEVRQVVAYARERGIRVVPEFDIPGHTTSWFTGYPELASAPGPYAIERKWGIFEPVMDPSRESTYEFLDGFFAEMASLFPDPYFHIGGDEVEDAQWKRSPSIQAFAREHGLTSSRALQAYFNGRVEKLLRKHGKTMIGWDEVLEPGLPADTVIQSWRGPEALVAAASKGYRALLSSGYYLDHLQPAATHYAVDPWQGLAAAPDSPDAARILGGEACMWAEYVSSETVDSRVWPRMAAIAERFWSPRNVTAADSMYARLETVSRYLEWVGIRHRSNAPMLDRLTGGRPAEPLRILAAVSEALGIEGRRGARQYTSLVPLNRFVDAVPPESELARRLEGIARQAAANPDAGALLRATFGEWQQNGAAVARLAESNALLAEVVPLSRNLSAVASIGLDALDNAANGRPASEDWVTAKQRELDRLEAAVPEIRLAAVRPVRALLAAIPRRTAASRIQALESAGVRFRNEPPHNGTATVPNWTFTPILDNITLERSASGGRSRPTTDKKVKSEK